MLLQNNLGRVCSVARPCNSRLNIGKCVAIRFGACNAGHNLSCSYTIDSKVFGFVTSHRDLGVLVDSKLHFHDHIHNVARKAGVQQVSCYALPFVTLQFLCSLYLCYTLNKL